MPFPHPRPRRRGEETRCDDDGERRRRRKDELQRHLRDICSDASSQQITKTKLCTVLQEKNSLNIELIGHSLKASKYDQVQSDYDQLRQTFSVVSQERDTAQWERSQLQGKVESLEQVLKHMCEAAVRRHDHALEVLHTQQQEISQLQRAQVEADGEHEGAVHLLKVKVCDLEQKCRSQNEQFHQLSKTLLNFHQGPDTVDVLHSDLNSTSQFPLSPDKVSQFLNGLDTQAAQDGG